MESALSEIGLIAVGEETEVLERMTPVRVQNEVALPLFNLEN